MNIIIPGRIPSKKNGKRIMKRGNRHFIGSSQDHEDWHRDTSFILRSCMNGIVPEKVTEVSITFFPGDNRKSDSTNKAESIMDLLVDNGVLEDDNWFAVPNIHLHFGGVDKLNPRAEINII